MNRRTVVDQATDDATRLLKLIYPSGCRDNLSWTAKQEPGDQPTLTQQHTAAIRRLREALASLAADDSGPPLAVSTLRGELADNGEWKRNPAGPAIIIGTVDMIGSKLLFSGYGDGRYGRAHHAGLIGQDALVVHDEAHLSPAFDGLLRKIAAEQERTKEARPIRVMRLSATTRAIGTTDDNVDELRLEATDREDPVVMQRVSARKQLRFVDTNTGGRKDAASASKIAELAVAHDSDGCRALVYVRSPETAAKARDAITKEIVEKAKQAGTPISADDARRRTGLLTGTIRGFERDELARSDLFTAFKSGSDRSAPLPNTLYLVSTSAGEVGADWDADHLVCDLTTLDSMTQRFGRVNRLGGDGRSAEIVVVVEKSQENADDKAVKKAKARDPLDAATIKTGEILRQVEKNGGDVSPAALGKVIDGLTIEAKRAAFSPEPTILPATDILFDHWSLTSIAGRLPGRPEVGPYLHGVAEWEPPETYVAWRAEISELAQANVSNDDLEEIFDVFPLRAAEKLRDRADRVFGQLRKIPGQLDAEDDPRVVLMKLGSARWVRLSELAPSDSNQKNTALSLLEYATVILPVEIGGLRDGMLDGNAPPPQDPKVLDVAEAAVTGQSGRQRVWINAEDSVEPLIGNASNDSLTSKMRITLRDDEDAEADGVETSHRVAIEYRVERSENGEPGLRIALSAHNGAVAVASERIAAALGLSPEMVQAVKLAGQLHDIGKHRDVWQRYARNLPHRNEPGGAIAKSDRYSHWNVLGGYRHEFGSMLEATTDKTICGHPDRELILHLIGAHHGWNRPHFDRRASDNEKYTTAQNEAAAIEAVQRFARLQQRFGRWGLAWLESLLRCADALASSETHNGGVA